MKTAFAACILATAITAIDAEELEFLKYMALHRKQYHTIAEFTKRKQLWGRRDALIKEFMSEH